MTDRLAEQIAACVSGDLAPGEVAEVEAVLMADPEAGELYKRLHEDASRLRSFPRQQLGPDFAERVLQARRDRLPQPIIRVGRPACKHSIWVPRIAVAAAVLVAVGVTIWLWEPPVDSVRHTIAKADCPKLTPVPVNPLEEPKPELATAEPEKKHDPEPGTVAAARPPANPEKPKPVRRPSVIATKDVSKAPGDTVPARVALPLSIRDLEKEEVRNQLRGELAKGDDHHLDLYCKDANRGLERFLHHARAAGFEFLIDETAQTLLKRRTPNWSAVYFETLTAEETARLMTAITAGEKRAGDGAIDGLLLAPMKSDESRELTRLFGGTPTADKSPKDKADRPAKAGIVFPFHPTRVDPARSKELKQFIDSRKPREPGTVTVLIVIRRR